jgi:hypothetical protein
MFKADLKLVILLLLLIAEILSMQHYIWLYYYIFKF